MIKSGARIYLVVSCQTYKQLVTNDHIVAMAPRESNVVRNVKAATRRETNCTRLS